MSYRNDGEAPRSRAGTYTLGATEWRDVDAAVGFARRRGAKRIILMGWSMGGAIALQLSLNSAHRDAIAGLILESPVVDWRIVLEYQARALRVPAAVSGLAIGALQSEWATPITRAGSAIPFDRLDVVARAGELRHPILILHSDDDGFVPSDASHDLVVARPDLVELKVFEVARHTKLWNYDQERWSDEHPLLGRSARISAPRPQPKVAEARLVHEHAGDLGVGSAGAGPGTGRSAGSRTGATVTQYSSMTPASANCVASDGPPSHTIRR